MVFNGSSKVQEEKGKKLVRCSIPAIFQGHTFVVDLSINYKEQPISGEYKIEYVLGNTFANDQFSLSGNDLDDGFSNLVLAGKMKELKHLECHYAPRENKTQRRTAKLYFKCSDASHQIQRIVVEIKESDIDSALKFSNSFVQQFLDILTYKKGIPLEVKRIEILDKVSGNPLQNYVQIPYSLPVEVFPHDLEAAPHIPDRIKPLLGPGSPIRRHVVKSKPLPFAF